LCESLHQEGNSENVHPFVHKDLDGGRVGPYVVGAKHTRNVSAPEFSTGLVYTEPLESAVA
jgi:hypothetical protein